MKSEIPGLVCLAAPRSPGERRDFSSWKGDHPQSVAFLGSILLELE